MRRYPLSALCALPSSAGGRSGAAPGLHGVLVPLMRRLVTAGGGGLAARHPGDAHGGGRRCSAACAAGERGAGCAWCCGRRLAVGGGGVGCGGDAASAGGDGQLRDGTGAAGSGDRPGGEGCSRSMLLRGVSKREAPSCSFAPCVRVAVAGLGNTTRGKSWVREALMRWLAWVRWNLEPAGPASLARECAPACSSMDTRRRCRQRGDAVT